LNLFQNLKVIELANVLAGPSVGQFFAELGAQVIKIESPKTGGDVTRSWKLHSESTENSVSAYFSSVNWGKQSLVLDLADSNQKEQLYELVKTADLVIASYKPNDATKLGVDYKTLSQLNPSLIYGKITGYGEDDERVGYDAIVQAEAGFMFMNGQPNSTPTKMPVALVDVLTAHQLKQALLLAIIERLQTGKGTEISVSLFDSAVSALVNQATNWLNASHIPQQMGSEHPNIAPYGTLFRTKDDKWLILAVGTDKQFHVLCGVLGLEWEDKFQTNAQRVIHRKELNKKLVEKISKHNLKGILPKLQQAKIPAGSVNSMPQVFETPQAKSIMLQSGELKGIRQFVGKSENWKWIDLSEPPQFGE
jgi:crotonobetainyl-CoA:carnitine CoA-transferase CaiB-like acyl-CoA transferase